MFAADRDEALGPDLVELGTVDLVEERQHGVHAVEDRHGVVRHQLPQLEAPLAPRQELVDVSEPHGAFSPDREHPPGVLRAHGELDRLGGGEQIRRRLVVPLGEEALELVEAGPAQLPRLLLPLVRAGQLRRYEQVGLERAGRRQRLVEALGIELLGNRRHPRVKDDAVHQHGR